MYSVGLKADATKVLHARPATHAQASVKRFDLGDLALMDFRDPDRGWI